MSRTDGGTIRVLHVDDEPDQVELSSLYLERERESLTVLTETSATDALSRLAETSVDCIVSDYDMPGMDGLAFLEMVRESHPELPFILFTGKGSEEIASDAISAGVTDYLQKEVGSDQYAVLANRIERAVDANRAKDALAESERMLSTLISNLPGMVYRCRNEPDWPMTFVSDGCRDLTGYEPADLESAEISWGGDVIHPDDRGTLWDPVQAALDEREPFEVTYRIVTAEGETRWLWEQGRGIFEDGEVVAIEGFMTDITDRTQAQQRRKKYELIVESMDDAAFILDDDLRFEFANQSFLEATGVDQERVSGADGGLFVAETARETYENALSQLERGDADELSMEVELTIPDYGSRTVNLRLTRLTEDGQFQGVVGVARKVSEQADYERDLERYRRLVETAGDPMYVLDAEGTITIANDAFVEHVETDRSALIGSSIEQYMDESDIDRGTDLLVEIMQDDDRRSGRFEFTVEIPGKGDRRIENHLSPLTEDGDFTGSVGILRDITEHKERERELERYETLVENVGDPMYALDASGTITMANRAMAEHLNCPREDIVGSTVSSFMVDADVETGTAVIADLIASEDRRMDSFEMQTVSADGDYKQTEDKIAILTEDGEYTGSVGVIRDISDRKERERELERYETIIQAVGDPVYTLDADGNFTFINDAIEPLTGHDPDTLVGKHVSMVMEESDVAIARDLIKTLLKSDDRTNATFEMALVTEAGTDVPSENHMALLPFEDDGQFRGTAGVVRDITERKQREQRLEQFASVVSHDLRNPLNVIQGRIEYIQHTGELDHVDTIADAADRMERLIDDLLALARQGQTVGETEPVDVAETARLAWQQVETGTATLTVEDAIETVEADQHRLRELFENLFRNALEHASTDGRDLTVRVGAIDGGGIYVADDGPGIPPEDRENVFEHGYTENEDGTGFGLAIVESIAEAHGWSISLTDGWAGGARFEITGL
ncbi:MAG: PAS domain S-box protein [Halorientalis sp.]